MLKLLKFLLIVGAAFLLVANIEPYVSVTRLIFSDPNGVDVCADLGNFPFIGRAISGLCAVIGGAIWSVSGFLVWAIFQLIELLPIATSFNIPFLSQMVDRAQSAPQIEEEAKDRDSVRKLKQRHNTVVERSLGALLTFSWVMYLVDLGLMAWLYQPLNEVGDLDLMALIRVLLGVFGVELIVMGLSLINNIIDPTRINYRTVKQREVREY